MEHIIGDIPVPAIPASVQEVAADCGGFVATKKWGNYRYTSLQYIKWLYRLGNKLSWAAMMDYCCEDEITSGQPGIVKARQDATTGMAYHFWKTGNFTGAVENFKEALLRDERDAEAQYLLHKCLHAMGKLAEANTAWTVARQLNSKVEGWEARKQIPDLFRIQSNCDESSFRQLQLEVHAVHGKKLSAQQ